MDWLDSLIPPDWSVSFGPGGVAGTVGTTSCPTCAAGAGVAASGVSPVSMNLPLIIIAIATLVIILR